MPPPLLAEPKLKTQDFQWQVAFSTLSNTRQSGMGGSSPILMSEMKAFGDMAGIVNRAHWAKYVTLMQDLDRVWLNHHAEKQRASK